MIVQKCLTSNSSQDNQCLEKTDLTDDQKKMIRTTNFTESEVKTITEKLLQNFFEEYASESTNISTFENLIMKILKSRTKEILFEDDEKFKKLIDDATNSEIVCIKTIADNIFDGGKPNWDKFLRLIVFGAGTSKKLKETNQSHKIASLSQSISSYLTEDNSWFLKHNDWKGFILFFKSYEWQFKISSSVLISLFGLGIALFAYFIF
ncbi:Bcl-2 like protein [Lymphocystis disease virus 3]|uniref:Bcl-2 like protein n=1 Tax=Lymphocystis disease virus 3 TaxID=2560566 RepID=A0A1B2RVY4_9VIRU|nr:Bcl-2 like protein [Lymphocystis disease virus Sa]AOC55162.1 Bcl-2 like protein [Lymphocystis disease virus 3]